MSWTNYLTPHQLRNFRRRCRFTACGEPCDVFTGPTDPDDSTSRDVMFVTVNSYNDDSAQWLEATSHIYADPTGEIRPDYLKLCRKAPEADARAIIARELDRWAAMPAGTVTGWSPEQIKAEADRIRTA